MDCKKEFKAEYLVCLEGPFQVEISKTFQCDDERQALAEAKEYLKELSFKVSAMDPNTLQLVEECQVFRSGSVNAIVLTDVSLTGEEDNSCTALK